MADDLLEVVDGPDKPALQWALAYPDREQVHFTLDGDAVDARISRMDEEGSDGFRFHLEGTLTSGVHKNRPFAASYSVETRSGTMRVQQ